MLTAIVHLPSPNIGKCEITHLTEPTINVANAIEQHRLYCETLINLGVHLKVLDENIHLPDSVFVEDPAIVLDEVGIILSMGADTRKEEPSLLAQTLSAYGPLERIQHPATIEGGDILRIRKTLFVGNSARTNRLGIDALHEIVTPLGYKIVETKVSGCLHLKTGCTALDDKTVLINPDWVDEKSFSDFERVRVPTDEPFAANILSINNTVSIHSGFDMTRRLLESKGYNVHSINISEFLKAEAGLTCMSIIFDG